MSDVISHWHLLYNCIKFEGPGIKLENVKLLAPIPKPHGAIICIGKNYADHVKEVDTWKTAPDITSPSIPKYPIVFTKAPQSVIGPGAAIVYPQAITTQVDYETELAVIIGKSGHCIKREDAISHVFGYTILNDVTARDLQKKHQQWFMGKSCDTFCPMGPWIVPATEINGEDLQIQCWVNGELRQNGRTSDMIFSIPELIETISSGITLQPGDIIATGTPSGVGSGFNPPRHLVPGDSICMKIEGNSRLASDCSKGRLNGPASWSLNATNYHLTTKDHVSLEVASQDYDEIASGVALYCPKIVAVVPSLVNYFPSSLLVVLIQSSLVNMDRLSPCPPIVPHLIAGCPLGEMSSSPPRGILDDSITWTSKFSVDVAPVGVVSMVARSGEAVCGDFEGEARLLLASLFRL
ncbi:hypothetical protein SUGI_1167860 [Cryptomeria japonica]|nr:hypothetical protein SUGI_1167860 [Cryptomeria japonica]